MALTNFDWARNGTAFTTGSASVANSVFTLTYFANAASISPAVHTTHMGGNSTTVVLESTHDCTIVAIDGFQRCRI